MERLDKEQRHEQDDKERVKLVAKDRQRQQGLGDGEPGALVQSLDLDRSESADQERLEELASHDCLEDALIPKDLWREAWSAR